MVYSTQHPDGLRKSLIFLGLRNVNLTNLIWNEKNTYVFFSLTVMVQW